MASTTALALSTATGILTNLVDKERDVTKCDVCLTTLTGDTFSICRFPDCAPDTRGLAKEHEGHTACKSCVDELSYIGDAGSCKVCLDALGGRRSSIKLAGVALRPAVKNSLANKMIEGFQEAEKCIAEAREQEDMDRIQQQAQNRQYHVEDVRRRRREEEEEMEANRKKAEEEMEANRKKAEEEMEAKRKKAEEEMEAKRKKHAEKSEEAKKKIAEATAEAKRIYEEAVAKKNEQELANHKSRKKKEMSADTLQSFREKRQKTAAEKKEKLANYDSLLREKEVLEKQLELASSLAFAFVDGDRTRSASDFKATWKEALEAAAQEEEGEEDEEGEEEEVASSPHHVAELDDDEDLRQRPALPVD